MNFIKLKITYLAVLFLLINALQSFAQNKSNTNSFSFGYLLSDFGNSKNGEDRKFHKFKQMDKGFVVNYAHYLNRSFDISTTLGYSKVSFGGLLNQKYAMINVALNLKYKFNNGYIFNENDEISRCFT